MLSAIIIAREAHTFQLRNVLRSIRAIKDAGLHPWLCTEDPNLIEKTQNLGVQLISMPYSPPHLKTYHDVIRTIHQQLKSEEYLILLSKYSSISAQKINDILDLGHEYLKEGWITAVMPVCPVSEMVPTSLLYQKRIVSIGLPAMLVPYVKNETSPMYIHSGGPWWFLATNLEPHNLGAWPYPFLGKKIIPYYDRDAEVAHLASDCRI